MAQIFHPSFNSISKLSLVFGNILAVGALLGILQIGRSPYVTRAQETREQPVPFSHKHHVSGLGIDCRYCHTSVETGAFAGIPPTKTCMTCHSQIWADSPMLEPVRESYRTDQSIEWLRLHDLADFVYFNHSIHVKKGVGCDTCHGPVNEMPLMWKEETLQMEWCLECHREPEKFVRPREEVFNYEWVPPTDQLTLGRELVEKYDIQRLDNCSVCHR
jgi:hypothetical protein